MKIEIKEKPFWGGFWGSILVFQLTIIFTEAIVNLWGLEFMNPLAWILLTLISIFIGGFYVVDYKLRILCARCFKRFYEEDLIAIYKDEHRDLDNYLCEPCIKEIKKGNYLYEK